MSTYRNFIITQSSLVIVFDDRTVPLIAANPLYNRIKEMLEKNDTAHLEEMVDYALRIRRHSSGKFDVVDGNIVHNGHVMPEALSKRILNFVDLNIDVSPLVAFWNNLCLNPSDDSRQDLYAFLEHNHIAITKDGCFIAYKRVNENFKDCYTGKFDNSIGAIVSMPREDVDPDRNRTCSRGLHVAAYRYAHDMYSNGQLLEVKVNPKDVVAVPTDYNNEKMRVCEYKVIRVTDGPREEPVYQYDDSYNNPEYDSDYIDDIDDDDDEYTDFDDGDPDYDDIDDDKPGYQDDVAKNVEPVVTQFSPPSTSGTFIWWQWTGRF